MSRVEVTVVGAGAVGLAVARSLALAGVRVALLERHSTPGLEQSTHNSQVVHSGLFAHPGTLRAQLNVLGNRMLYKEAPGLGVAIEASGTLVVAVSGNDLGRLSTSQKWGVENGVPGICAVRPDAVAVHEPNIAPVRGALFAPSGGRIDAASYVAALDRELVRLGVDRHYGAPLEAASHVAGAWDLRAGGGVELRSRAVVNAAGVASAHVAGLLGAGGYRIYPCLGEYARVRPPKNRSIRSMVYGSPPPGFPGIGVHLTRTIGGDLLIGPSATYQESPVAPAERRVSLREFHREARVLLPDLDLADLEFGPAGVRAKPVPPGSDEPFQDFVVREDPPGSRVIQMIGIESPGLTASLALGEHVASLWRAFAAR